METRLPTDILETEHRYIKMVVDAIVKKLEFQNENNGFVIQEIEQIMDFMRSYADQCHHGKEEDLLFPALIEKGVPTQGCPIGALMADHKRGRNFVGELSKGIDLLKNGDQSGNKNITDGLNGIALLYPNHIWKEDYLLFPMTMKVMNADELRILSGKFEQVDEKMGREKIESYQSFALNLNEGTIA